MYWVNRTKYANVCFEIYSVSCVLTLADLKNPFQKYCYDPLGGARELLMFCTDDPVLKFSEQCSVAYGEKCSKIVLIK